MSLVPAAEPRPAAGTIELVTIGNELLLGATLDTNAAWLGRTLATAGLRLARHATVGDDAEAIRAAVADALGRSGTVLCSGGLGPTSDDITRPAVAALLQRPLHVDAALLEGVRARFERRGLVMPESSRNQAEVPEGARVLANPRGTAPGLVLEDERGAVVLLPGVPHEFRGLVADEVLPFLRARLAPQAPILHRLVRTFGLTESAVADRVEALIPELAPLTVAFLPSWTGVDLRVTSWGAFADEVSAEALDAAAATLAEPLGAHVYARADRDLADVVGAALRRGGLVVATAESCTGGLVGERLTASAGASDYYHGGVVAYDDDAKVSLLGVARTTLAEHGAVSGETAAAMVTGVRARTAADAAVAVTGIAGPGGGTAEKPVGTVWIAAGLGERVETQRLSLPGDRTEVRRRSSQGVLMLLLRLLQDR